MSRERRIKITPVKPFNTKRDNRSRSKYMDAEYLTLGPWMVTTQLKILIPVGTAIIIVAAVK